MLAVGISAECLVNHRNQILDNHIIERSSIVAALFIYILAWTGNERLLYIATLHDNNHRLSLAFCYQVVHDVLHHSLLAPARFVFAHAMLQIEHRIALGGVGFIFGRGINHGAAELLLRGCIVRY